MPQPSLGKNRKKDGFSKRILAMLLAVGMKLDKFDPQRKGYVDYEDPSAFPMQQEPTDLDVQAVREEKGDTKHKAEFSDPRFPFKTGETPNSLERPMNYFPGRSGRR